MISPLSAGFSVLTRGLDGKARRGAVLKTDQDLTGADQGFSLAVLREIQNHPDVTLSQLERAFEHDTYRAAVLPSVLADAQYEGLVGVDSPTSTDPAWSLTALGEERMKDAEQA
jgi:hypothetical protein